MRANRKRLFALSLSATALLFISFVEVIFAGDHGTGLVLTTLFGVPGAWLLLRSAKWAIRTLGKADLFSPVMAFPIEYIL